MPLLVCTSHLATHDADATTCVVTSALRADGGRMRCRTVFAMPETTIGFFPDVGASHFLHRLPPGLGLLLGLTGASLSGAAVFLAGAATHFVTAHDVAKLKTALCGSERDSEHSNSSDAAAAPPRDFTDLDTMLRGYAAEVDEGEKRKYAALEALAARHFASARSVVDIIASLEAAADERALCDSLLAKLAKCALSCCVRACLIRL